MSRRFVRAAVLLVIVQALPAPGQQKDQPKYRNPDLPKEEVAILSSLAAGVDEVDGVPVRLLREVRLMPGPHRLAVSWGLGETVGSWTTVYTGDGTYLLVDVKKGRRYVVEPSAFWNGQQLPHRTIAQAKDVQRWRTELAALLRDENTLPAQLKIGEKLYYELHDVTGLPGPGASAGCWEFYECLEAADWQKQLESMNREIAKKPHDPWGYHRRGMVQLMWMPNGDKDKAIADFDRALELDPRMARSLKGRAWAHYLKGEHDQALPDFDKALILQPEMTEAYNMRGHTWLAKRNVDRAIADYTRAVESSPVFVWGYFNRGKQWLQRGDLEKALADLDRAIAICPKFAPAYVARGDMRLKQGDNNKAVTDYTAALAIDMKSLLAFMGRGDAWYAKKDYDTAIVDYSQAIKIDGRSARALAWRGDSYLQKGDNDRAIADLTKAIDLDPASAWVRNDRGVALFRKGEFDAAAADFTEVERLDPNLAIAHDNLGDSLMKKGNGSQAAAAYLRAVDPWLARRNADRAIASCDRAITADPRRADSYQRRAELFVQLRQFEKAVADYTQAVALAATPERERRLNELKALAPASAAQPASPAPVAAAPARQKTIVQGVVLNYPSRTPVGRRAVALALSAKAEGSLPVLPLNSACKFGGLACTESDERGSFRLEVDFDQIRPFVVSGMGVTIVVFAEGQPAETGAAGVAKLVTGHLSRALWDIPIEPGVLDLSAGGDLFLAEKKK